MKLNEPAKQQKGSIPSSKPSTQSYTLWPTLYIPGFKEGTFDSSGLSVEGIFISASTVPQGRGLVGQSLRHLFQLTWPAWRDSNSTVGVESSELWLPIPTAPPTPNPVVVVFLILYTFRNFPKCLFPLGNSDPLPCWQSAARELHHPNPAISRRNQLVTFMGLLHIFNLPGTVFISAAGN